MVSASYGSKPTSVNRTEMTRTNSSSLMIFFVIMGYSSASSARQYMPQPVSTEHHMSQCSNNALQALNQNTHPGRGLHILRRHSMRSKKRS